jgi:hypothetical protein
MRDVDHLAIDAQRPGGRIRVESGDDLSRVLDLGFGRRVAAIDRRDLVRMNCHAAGESVAPRPPAVALKPFRIAKIDEYGVDRRNLGSRGREEALSPDDLIGEVQAPSGSLLSVAPSAADRSSAPQVNAARRGCAGA